VRVAIVGVGLIGGSIGLAARERLGATVAGFDRSRDALDAALARHALDRACAGIADAVDAADAVFVAVPVGELPGAVDAALAAVARPAEHPPLYGDGHAAERIAAVVAASAR
jgi:prephenate dehydrogenase